jgi:CBS domain-containing protein
MQELLVRDVMTRDVVCVSPDFALDALAALLSARGIQGAPVVDVDGVVIGVVSQTDLLRQRAGAETESAFDPGCAARSRARAR